MSEFITITLIGLLMIISPGPDFAIVTKTSIAHGRIAGILSALGVGIANLCHVSINLFGIGVIISESVIAFTVMKILGAVYLLYIGFKGICVKPQHKIPLQDTIETIHTVNTINTTSSHRSFLTGFLTSILNPKACLFYLSFFSVILSATTPLPRQILYGTWLATLACLWFSLVAVFFTHPYIAIKLKNGKHWIERVAGGALMLLGIRLLSAEAAT